MDKAILFAVQKHYLVDIAISSDVSSPDLLKTWSWDIYISSNDQGVCRGRAAAPGKNVSVPWTELAKGDVLEEMIALCQRQMP